ncbi:MAG: NIL domain-containing protein [Syntrophobacteraceae bacterium]|nr:4Fe-4S binding protein [Desulfobacteraceae bacterium]
MAIKRLVLSFPPHMIDQPITYQLVKKYDLMVNILRARITPNEEGRLVMEISGKKKNLDEGLAFLDDLGVRVEPLAHDIRWYEDRCIECTACTSICPTGALSVKRPEMRVTFKHEKCIACELCLPACPYKALEIVS